MLPIRQRNSRMEPENFASPLATIKRVFISYVRIYVFQLKIINLNKVMDSLLNAAQVLTNSSVLKGPDTRIIAVNLEEWKTMTDTTMV